MSATHILLAEDDLGHQRLFARLLDQAPVPVKLEAVETGRSLLRELSKHPYDCVLLDYNLPDCRADEVLSLLTRDERMPPIIVVSSDKNQDAVINCLRSGSVDFIPKSDALAAGELWSRISIALEARRAVREERRRMSRRLSRLAVLAETDALTGLPNRRYLDRFFSNKRQHPDRRGATAVMMLDVDHFKSINDRYGHVFGDRVLRTVADALSEMARPEDVVCRYGGEEFLVLRPSTAMANALAWGEQLRRTIARMVVGSNGQHIRTTVSVGLLCCSSRNVTQDSILQADAAMYLAKQGGRNRLCTWNAVKFRDLVEKLSSETESRPRRLFAKVVNALRDELGPSQWLCVTSHSREVADIAERLGIRLEMTESECKSLHLAGLLHDVGKLLIPEEVLSKSTPLTSDERLLLNRHSRDGADMAELLGADSQTVSYIRHHHAPFLRMTGNHDGADEIPRGARVLAVAEAAASMFVPRSRRSVGMVDEVSRELQQWGGTQLDPSVLQALPDVLCGNNRRVLIPG